VVALGGDLDWRLIVEFESKTHAHGVFSALRTHASAALAANRLKDGVVAEHEAQWLRIYASSYDALQGAQVTVANVIELEGVHAEEQAEHRAGDGAAWESVELPRLLAAEATLVSEHQGQGPWGAEVNPDHVQVHFELESKHLAQAFAKELASDGYDVHCAGSFVFVFADDAAAARELGNALEKRAPATARLFVEGEGRTLFI
jgi:hypothetical protein